MRPENTSLSTGDDAERMQKLLDMIEDWMTFRTSTTTQNYENSCDWRRWP
jgi:hypothetical protein